MEFGSRLRFILLSIAAIIILILSAWGIASLARNLINGTSTSTTENEEKVVLTDYIRPNTSVKVTVEGPIVADENYRSYEIEVGQDYRRVTLFKGYGKAVVAQKTYDNNGASYESFLKALSKIGFTNKISSAATDEKGACATGYRYIYEVKDFDEEALRLWGVSCSTKTGNFGGSGASVRALFKSQIPDIDEFSKTYPSIFY